MSPLRRQIRSYGPYRVTLGPAKLFLDDIQDIISAIESFIVKRQKEEGSSLTANGKEEPSEPSAVVIVAGNAIADSVEDLREASKEELNHLSLVLESPHFNIDLWHIDADITTVRDDLEARTLADDIAAFVKSKRALFRGVWLASVGLAYLIILGAGNLSVAIYQVKHHGPYLPSLVFGIMFLGSGVLFSITAYRRSSHLGTVRVVAMRRNESRRLSSRARRDIFIAVVASVLGGLLKTQFEEIDTNGCAQGIKKRVKWPPIIGEKDLPGLEVRDRTLDGSADGTDLVIVFVFTRVEFTVLWLLGRRDVARPLKPLVGDNRSGKVENLLHIAFQLLHVMVTSLSCVRA